MRKQQKEWLESCLHASGIAVYHWDLSSDKWGFLYNLANLFPLYPEVKSIKTGAEFLEKVHPDDRHLFKKISWENLELYHQIIDFRLVMNDGCEFWMQNSFVNYQNRTPTPSDQQPILVGTLKDISGLKHENMRLSHLAHIDELTGLLTRSKLKEKIAIAMASGIKYGHKSAFIAIGIDNLAEVNRSFGYDVADELIKAVGHKLRETLRTSDIIGRLSGGKFGVLLINYQEADLNLICERILDVIRLSLFETESGYLTATVSIGGVLIPGKARTTVDVISFAEEALSHAKFTGRDHYFEYNNHNNDIMQRQKNIEIVRNLVLALKEDRVLLALQPLVNDKGEIQFYEALARIRQHDESVISAGYFIPLAEKTGFIQMLDKRIVDLTLQALQDNPDFVISMNLSANSIDDRYWFDQFIAQLKLYPHAAQRLIVEITETAAINNMQDCLESVKQLRALGCRIAIDDFGAGYTSFNNLRILDIDIVKIDGSYIKDIHNQPVNAFFVKTFIDFARHFNIEIVAEMVEIEEEFNRLRDYHINYYQGYFFGKPKLLSDFNAEIQQSRQG